MARPPSSRALRPDVGCLRTAVGYIFNHPVWLLQVVCASPLQLAVLGDTEFDHYRTGTTFPGYQDTARSAVVKAICKLSDAASGSAFSIIYGSLPAVGGTSSSSPALVRCRRMIRRRIAQAIGSHRYEGLLALIDGSAMPVVDTASTRPSPRTPVQVKVPETSNELDDLLEGIESGIPLDYLKRLSEQDDQDGDEDEEEDGDDEYEIVGRPDQCPQPIPAEPAPAICPSPKIQGDLAPTRETPGQEDLLKAVKFIFDTLRPRVRPFQRSPFRVHVQMTDKLKSYRSGQRIGKPREEAITTVVRGLVRLVKNTDQRTFTYLSGGLRPGRVKAWTDLSDPFDRFLDEVHTCILEAVNSDGAAGLDALVAVGLGEHARRFELVERLDRL
jgi:hypothetical protein